MIEIFGNFWDFDAIFYCITTNGIVDKNGNNIMGRGIAKEASDKFPGLAFDVGFGIKEHGNHVFIVQQVNWKWRNKIIVTFPTKYNWKYKSSLDLIKRSAEELEILANVYKHQKFVLAYPGIGNGGLLKEYVKRVIEPILSDNIYVISRKEGLNR